MKKMTSGISIIICCYNSAGRINETLRFIFALNVPNDLFCEVIIVDNSSNDNTAMVALDASKKYGHTGIDFRLVHEQTPGLTAARRKGVQESKYDLIVFCDDDNHLDPNYIEQAYHVMNNDPEIGIAGGWVKPKLPFYPGKWIESIYPALAIGKHAEHSQYVDWVFGAGMVFRKKIFDDLRSKNIQLLLTDRKGKSQSSGGDAEICQVARFIGYRIFFTPSLVLYHQIEAKRLTRKSILKSNFQNFYATVHLFILENLIKNKNQDLSKIKQSLLKRRTARIVKAIPRLLVLKRWFLNFLELYVGLHLIFWILFHGSEIKQSFFEIRHNLYNE